MANNLLDALKKAGLADEKKARKAENAKKQQQHRDLKAGSAGKKTEDVLAAASTPETLSATHAENIQPARRLVEERLSQIYKNAALTDVSGRKRFYFKTIDNYIDCIQLSDVASALLERGKYAVVAGENLEDYIVVRRATALAIEAVDRRRVVVFRRQEV